jgi:hypothetical protein
MTGAPERIWAWGGSYPKFDDDDWFEASATNDPTRGGVEYVRVAPDADAALPELCEECGLPIAECSALALARLGLDKP